MTMNDLVRYLHQQIIERLPREDEAELGSLSITLQELAQAADHYQDVQLWEILDDLSYVVNETLMGARVKGEWALPAVEAKIKALG